MYTPTCVQEECMPTDLSHVRSYNLVVDAEVCGIGSSGAIILLWDFKSLVELRVHEGLYKLMI